MGAISGSFRVDQKSHIIPMLPLFSETEIPGNQALKIGGWYSNTSTAKEIKVIFPSAKRAKSQHVIIIITVCNWYMLLLLLVVFAIFMPLVVVVSQ